MGLKPGETHLEYRQRMIDSVSKSFCAAKWLNATIWLNSGLTASCHHPPSHPIDRKEIGKNPSAIHNTQEKKLARQQMLKGERPKECEYCWKIEDLSADHISDRVFKTFIFKDEDVQQLATLDWRRDVNLKTLEIAFDRTCQFACMYCNPSYSTTWVKDIRDHGPYQNLPTDKRGHFIHTHEAAEPFPENNPYVNAFWSWWPELSQSLEELRITGGEPLLSPNFWRILESFKNSEASANMRLAVNSNLGARDEIIDRLIREGKSVPHLEIYTSGEAFGPAAEYIRDGLKWERWTANMVKLMDSGVVKRMHVMMTINSLCLFSMRRFLDQMLEWKSSFGTENPTFSVNILRFPTFQSPLVLPPSLREECRRDLSAWLERVSGDTRILNFERDSLSRMLDYLARTETPTEGSDSRLALEKDLKRYLQQYDRRREKNYSEVMPESFNRWMDGVED
jgi:hypothetical protein